LVHRQCVWCILINEDLSFAYYVLMLKIINNFDQREGPLFMRCLTCAPPEPL